MLFDAANCTLVTCALKSRPLPVSVMVSLPGPNVLIAAMIVSFRLHGVECDFVCGERSRAREVEATGVAVAMFTSAWCMMSMASRIRS